MSYDGETFRFYLDGGADSSYGLRPVYEANGYPFLIGMSSMMSGNWPLAGQLDDLRLYLRALPPEEILQVMAEQAQSSMRLRASHRPGGQVRLIISSPDGPINPLLLERVELWASASPTTGQGEWTRLPAPVWEGETAALTVLGDQGQRFFVLVENP